MKKDTPRTQVEKMDCIKRAIPKSSDSINLRKYMEKDNTPDRRKADAWGRGDYKELIKENINERKHEIRANNRKAARDEKG